MFTFKKISSVLASAVMLSSTIGFAAAASYPAPFVVGGLADGAVVYGANAAITDASAAIDVGNKLSTLATSGTATTTGAVSGEAVELYSSGQKLYINDSLNAVRTVLTKSELDLPTVLATTSFSGNVDASITHTIDIGSNPRITYKKQPTSSDDPNYALQLSTTQANYIYNATASFSKSINLSSADSEGNAIKLFGMDFTIGSASDTDTLVLLKSAKKVDLSTDSPTADVIITGETYTVELVSASDTAATIKVTNSAGASESKEINEAASKKVNGITIAVVNADETNLKLSASIIAGSQKVTLENNVAVKIGEDDKSIDGTLVRFGNGTELHPVEAMPKLTISVYASESDKDAIKAGGSFIDPVFGTFKLDFSGFNIGSNSTAIENIKVQPKSDDKLELTFTDHRGTEKTFQWAKNKTSNIWLIADDDNRNISVVEGANAIPNIGYRDFINYQEYVIVGNEDKGYLLKLSSVRNATADDGTLSSSSEIVFTDVFSSDTYEVKGTDITAAGVGTINIQGRSYTATVVGPRGLSQELYNVSLNYPDADSAGNNVILFPTIQTSKGAKVALYQPTMINLSNAFGNVNTNVSGLMFPDGDGFTTITVTAHPDDESVWAFGGRNLTLNTTGEAGVTVSVGRLQYNVTNKASTGTGLNLIQNNDTVVIYLQRPSGGNILDPALIVFEEKDDNIEYNALIVELEPGSTGDDGIGVDRVTDTWSNGSSSWASDRASNSKLNDRGDLWGTIATLDSSDSDQKSLTIMYPDQQIHAQIYAAEVSASITPGTTGGTGGGQILIVKDSEVLDVAGKNLFVVGGSCINAVAAKILESDVPLCGADFTTKTNVGAGQYIIKSVKSPYSDSKTALLVAGYEAQDTVNAVKRALEGVTTDIGTEEIGPVVTGG